MGRPSRIGIATGGYRTGSSSPGKICIATDGYRCPEAAPPITDPSLLGGGHGNVIFQPRPRVEEPSDLTDEQLALIAVAVIEELYE